MFQTEAEGLEDGGVAAALRGIEPLMVAGRVGGTKSKPKMGNSGHHLSEK